VISKTLSAVAHLALSDVPRISQVETEPTLCVREAVSGQSGFEVERRCTPSALREVVEALPAVAHLAGSDVPRVCQVSTELRFCVREAPIVDTWFQVESCSAQGALRVVCEALVAVRDCTGSDVLRVESVLAEERLGVGETGCGEGGFEEVPRGALHTLRGVSCAVQTVRDSAGGVGRSGGSEVHLPRGRVEEVGGSGSESAPVEVVETGETASLTGSHELLGGVDSVGIEEVRFLDADVVGVERVAVVAGGAGETNLGGGVAVGAGRVEVVLVDVEVVEGADVGKHGEVGIET
jgi:hypothetical protein